MILLLYKSHELSYSNQTPLYDKGENYTEETFL